MSLRNVRFVSWLGRCDWQLRRDRMLVLEDSENCAAKHPRQEEEAGYVLTGSIFANAVKELFLFIRHVWRITLPEGRVHAFLSVCVRG